MTETTPRRVSFLEALATRPMLLDAAMGTRLIARGLDLRVDDPSLWNLSHPETVLAFHREDVEAGSEALFTNSFGANADRLGRLGQSHRLIEINQVAAALARTAAGPDRFVIGSLGPCDSPLLEQAESLVASGVDALILETQDESGVDRNLSVLRRRWAVPILISLYRVPDRLEEAARRWTDLGASALGLNCHVGMGSMSEAVARLSAATPLPLLVKPSSNLPLDRPIPSDFFIRPVNDFLDLGVRLFGGCCGTTADHVRALRSSLDRRIEYGELAGKSLASRAFSSIMRP